LDIAYSFEGLQLNLLSFFEKGLLPDVFIQAEGREIPAHKALLGAQSGFFCQQFTSDPSHNSIQLEHKFKVVQTLIRFMYFGGLQVEGLSPLDGLDMLCLAEDLDIKALDPEDLKPVVLAGLTEANVVDTMNHPALEKYPTLTEGVCGFAGDHLQSMLNTRADVLLKVPRNLLSSVLQSACHHVSNDGETENVVKYCLKHTEMESACDLLRETKTWHWGSGMASMMRAPPEEGAGAMEESDKWHIHGVRSAMDTTPAKIVCGNFFDWTIRLDYGAGEKLRLVYESALPREANPRCVNRFPAAMFAWSVVYNGENVFNEKPVFICFPENVSLHWSTTLPISAADLTDDDDLEIMVEMAENPMISLVLYYFSADLKNTVMAEDILNRLPHIEYRCLSSYSLVKTHVQEG